jgi:hypothetical protein
MLEFGVLGVWIVLLGVVGNRGVLLELGLLGPFQVMELFEGAVELAVEGGFVALQVGEWVRFVIVG